MTEFQCFDWKSEDKYSKYTIYAFGLTKDKKTVAVHITDFKPFFYISVPEKWDCDDFQAFYDDIIVNIPENIVDQFLYLDCIENDILITEQKCKFEEGFTNNQQYPFIKMSFDSQRAMRSYASAIKKYIDNKDDDKKKDKDKEKIKLYETTLDPLLRFFHIQNIEPGGWVSIEKQKKVNKRIFNTHYEVTIPYDKIQPFENDSITPLKIASFDIECDSSHGDFPLANKDLRKLVFDAHQEYNRVRILYEQGKIDSEHFIDDTSKINYIYRLFTFGFYETDEVLGTREENNISKVFIKSKSPSKSFMKEIIHEFFIQGDNLLIFQELKGRKKDNLLNKLIGYNNLDWDVDNENNPPSKYYKEKYQTLKQVPIYIRNKYKNLKEKKSGLQNLNIGIQGDRIIQIGTVFYTFGTDPSKMKRTIVTLGSCDPIPGCEVIDIKEEKDTEYGYTGTDDGEKKLLKTWAKLIRDENPQYMTGYNIFGFDFKYIWDRAVELNIHNDNEFVRLGICKNRKCDLTRKQLSSSALGDNTLYYIKMDGRILFDLQKEVQKEYNLASYKLDNVAAEFMRGNIQRTKNFGRKLGLYTNDIGTLTEGKYIKIVEFNSIGEQFYNKGQKYKILKILLSKPEPILIVNKDFVMKEDFNYKWCEAKDDISPQDIFNKQKEGSTQRAEIAKYCVQDCELCIHLMNKFENITRNISMGNVCSVPTQFIYLRGQGVKVFSLVVKTASNYPEGIGTLISTKHTNFYDNEELEEGTERDAYEGAIVLPPSGPGAGGGGIYIDEPIAVMDFASLYPSSMLERNLSHETIITADMIKNYPKKYKIEDKEAKKSILHYDNQQFKVTKVTYENFIYKLEGKTWKKERHPREPDITCWYVQVQDNYQQGIIPYVVGTLLKKRKETKGELKKEKDPERKKILDGKQLSYKLTANSTYGQIGAKTSQIYLQDIAACTTATGREHIMTAKSFVEEKFPESKVVYGDTDSIFVNFSKWIHNNKDSEYSEKNLSGTDLLEATIKIAQKADTMFTEQNVYDKPQHLEYEKTFWPFIQVSKKRYTGDKYEFDSKKCSRTSMGLVTKRRDNAPIVKYVFGTIVEIIMKEKSVSKAVSWLKETLMKIAKGEFDMNMFIVTKTLAGNYKNPLGIAHKVLADRMGERDPGNKPATNDRIPYAYIECKEAMKKAKEEKLPFLQGDRVEHPDFIKKNNLKLDYAFYITNQIQLPVSQILELEYSKEDTLKIFEEVLDFLDPEIKLESTPVDELKKICKTQKLIYKGKKKSELIEHIIHYDNPDFQLTPEQERRDLYNSESPKQLQVRCKEKGLKTKGKKQELVTYLMDENNPDYKEDPKTILEEKYSKMKATELRKLCEESGLITKGIKKDYIKYLLDKDNPEYKIEIKKIPKKKEKSEKDILKEKYSKMKVLELIKLCQDKNIKWEGKPIKSKLIELLV